jgi:hypothetical protein
MIAPILARLVLALFVAPFFILVGAMAYALAASQAGEAVATVVLAAVLFGMLLALDRWLGAVARSFGERGDVDEAALGQWSTRPSASAMAVTSE